MTDNNENYENAIQNMSLVLSGLNDVIDQSIFDDVVFLDYLNNIIASYIDISDEDINQMDIELEQYINNTLYDETQTPRPTPKKVHLKSKQYKYYKKAIKDIHKECSICMDEYAPTSSMTITECNHSFHKDCIKEWSKYQENLTCPNCRHEL